MGIIVDDQSKFWFLTISKLTSSESYDNSTYAIELISTILVFCATYMRFIFHILGAVQEQFNLYSWYFFETI